MAAQQDDPDDAMELEDLEILIGLEDVLEDATPAELARLSAEFDADEATDDDKA